MPRGQHGRAAQRRRTRQAILAAATRLLSRGTTPSIDEVASEADVSRRTIYMYFPTVEQLLTDATVGMLSASDIDGALARPTSGDARARVELLARALLDAADEALPLGRRLIRLTVELPTRPAKQPRVRGHRRAAWVASAIEPLRLPKEQHDRLAGALMVMLGWEAMIVLRDLCGLDRAAEKRVLTWASRALVDAMMAERPTAPARRRKRPSRS